MGTEHAQIVEVQYPVMVDHRGEGFLPVQNHIIALGRFEAQRDGCKCIADVGGPDFSPEQMAPLHLRDPVYSVFFYKYKSQKDAWSSAKHMNDFKPF